MRGHQALSCPIHSKNKKKNALFNYRRRQEKARQWHQNQGLSTEMSLARSEGIDFNRPVGLKTLQSGKKLEQWVRVGGKVGTDFTEAGTDPKTLGIRIDQNTGFPEGRILKHAIVAKPIKVLRSWAGNIPDKPGTLIGGQGGGPQISMPKGWQNSVKILD